MEILNCGQGMCHWESDIWEKNLREASKWTTGCRGEEISGPKMRVRFEQQRADLIRAESVEERVKARGFPDWEGQATEKFVGQCKNSFEWASGLFRRSQ